MDDERICMKNIDLLTEDELRMNLRLLEIKYKNEHVSRFRLWLLLPYNLLIGGLTMHYTLNFKYYSKKFFKPKNFGYIEIIKYGTIQSSIFVVTYVTGSFFVTGLWHPILYIRGLAQIKGKQIDNAVKFDPFVQQHFLYNMMSYFGLSQQLINKAESELKEQRNDLEMKQYFAEDTLKLLNEPVDLEVKKKN